MVTNWKCFLLLSVLACCSATLHAQDSTAKKQDHKTSSDTTTKARAQKRGTGSMLKTDRKKMEYFRDTIKRERRKFDSTLFTNLSLPSTSDYANELGKVYQMLSDIPATLESFTRLDEIDNYLDNSDSAIEVLKERMVQSDENFNFRNLQMSNTLLDALDNSTRKYNSILDHYDYELGKISEQIDGLQSDTLMLNIFRDTSLTANFQPQLLQLKAKWREVDSLVQDKGKQVNTLRSQASAHAITIKDLISKLDRELTLVGSDAFGKERRYLWEPATTDPGFSKDSLKESLDAELQLAMLYFSNTSNLRLWLLLIGLVFFFWVWRNFRSLKRLDKMDAVDPFHFTLINPYPVGSALMLMLSLAPLFDLHAPSIYIESVQLVSMAVLTLMFRKRLDRELFYGWCVFIFLFLLLLIIRMLGLPLSAERWSNLFVESAAIGFGGYFLARLWKKSPKWIVFAGCLYLLFNILAVFCNLFGRVSFTHIFGYAAAYAFAQTAALGVFVKLVQEAFLLQIETSRTRKNYPGGFDYQVVSTSILNYLIVLAVVLWLIVFTTNLTLFDAISDMLTDLFTGVRKVGNFSFTLGGIVLFLGIIWFANFLQKYIAYFFGDTGDDAAADDKGQRSRLMVTRLILLIGGFLLAVAASGLPVDRITVILGALGVGIGLGLQGIVNNFVSGVILIFDRTLRIGDTVDIGDKRGRVKEIGIRTSTLLTEEGAEVIIPNGDVLSHNIINWTLSDNHIRQSMTFSIGRTAGSPEIGMNDLKAIIKKVPNVMEQKDPEILLNTINTKTTEVKIIYWCMDFNKSANTTSAVKAAVYQYLEKQHIDVQ